MFSLIRLSRKKLPAVIAIFAILMLFVAPEVSKTLEHRRMENREEHRVAADHAMPHSQAGMMDNMDMSTYHASSMQNMSMMMHGDMMDDIA